MVGTCSDYEKLDRWQLFVHAYLARHYLVRDTHRRTNFITANNEVLDDKATVAFLCLTLTRRGI